MQSADFQASTCAVPRYRELVHHETVRLRTWASPGSTQLPLVVRLGPGTRVWRMAGQRNGDDLHRLQGDCRPATIAASMEGGLDSLFLTEYEQLGWEQTDSALWEAEPLGSNRTRILSSPPKLSLNIEGFEIPDADFPLLTLPLYASTAGSSHLSAGDGLDAEGATSALTSTSLEGGVSAAAACTKCIWYEQPAVAAMCNYGSSVLKVCAGCQNLILCPSGGPCC
jgi:hypothetical protein